MLFFCIVISLSFSINPDLQTASKAFSTSRQTSPAFAATGMLHIYTESKQGDYRLCICLLCMHFVVVQRLCLLHNGPRFLTTVSQTFAMQLLKLIGL